MFLSTSTKAQILPEPQTFNAWQHICDTAQNKKTCRISQSVLAKSSNQRILLVRLFGGEAPTLVATTPDGIFLKPGLIIKVDNNRARAFAFETCNDGFCHTGIVLAKELIDEFKRGKQATFLFFDGAQKRVPVPVSLDGFTKAFNTLMGTS